MKTDTFAQVPVVIVGGGLSGLCAAAILARAGYAVTLFEKASAAGGRAMTKQHGKFSFNLGAHAFYLGGLSEKILGSLGVHYSGSLPAKESNRALEGGRLHALPVGVASLVGTTLLSFGAKGEFARFYALLRKVKVADLEGVSLEDWLGREVRNDEVRQLMLAVARLNTYANAPDVLSAGLVVPLLAAKVRYLDGGWQTLVDGLCEVAKEAGARIVTQARVAEIEVTGEGNVVRLADGRGYEAAAVVLATEPGTAASLVEDGTNEVLKSWAAQAVPAYVACLDVALRRLPRPQHLFALGIDCPLYYSVHSAWAKLAPEGGALIHTAKYLRPGEVAEPEVVRGELEGMLDMVQPGWRAEVVEKYFLPHMVSSNAIVQARYGGLSGRPGPEVPGIRNLYVVGDWVGREGQLADACFASASSAARMIMTTLENKRSDETAMRERKS
jgi:phytoene dehydrogenase-like protein